MPALMPTSGTMLYVQQGCDDKPGSHMCERSTIGSKKWGSWQKYGGTLHFHSGCHCMAIINKMKLKMMRDHITLPDTRKRTIHSRRLSPNLLIGNGEHKLPQDQQCNIYPLCVGNWPPLIKFSLLQYSPKVTTVQLNMRLEEETEGKQIEMQDSWNVVFYLNDCTCK